MKFFQAEELPETKGSAYRSGCLMASTYFVLRKIIEEYHLDEILGDIIGKDVIIIRHPLVGRYLALFREHEPLKLCVGH